MSSDAREKSRDPSKELPRSPFGNQELASTAHEHSKEVLAFLDHFGIADDDPRVNQYGGAIATGHPLASSGVRLMTQLARQFEENPQVRYGLTAMCIGIGMGGAVIWENPHHSDYGKELDITQFDTTQGVLLEL